MFGGADEQFVHGDVPGPACGVCRTDLHEVEGDLPPHRPGVIPGHEVVGEVAAIGNDVTEFVTGDRAGIAWLRGACGQCRYCRRGAENLCPASTYTGWDADGGYAEYTTVPAAFAHRLPHGYTDTELAPLLCAGIIMVMALATAANAMDRQVSGRPDPADRRPIPVVVADRFAPILGQLDAGQLTIVQHACLTMVANILASGRGRRRPDGLTLVPDEDGHLYAADVREPVLGVVEPCLVPVLETGAALIAGAPMVVEALSGIRSAPVRPPADRYAWLFTGLDPEQLATTRDAC